MVNITDFKEEKKPFVTVMDVMNATNRTAVVTDEANVLEFKSLSGSPYKKLVIPVVFDGKDAKIGVYADVGQRIALHLGHETKAWIGKKLTVKIAGAKTPYITVDVLEEPVDSRAVMGLKQ